MPAPLRVVVDPGSHALLNLGDISMLQVAVARMREAWPDAAIHVLTTDPERLAAHCPEARALRAAGRYAWVPEGRPPGLLRRTRLRRDPDARSYFEALRGADLFLVSGRGCLCDAFVGESLQLLGELEVAASLGVPTAMMGQGIGPLVDREVRARAAEVLQEVDLIAVREAPTALPLLAELGVDSGRVLVTGDDALELASGPAGPSHDSIGLNLREVDYAGVDEAVTNEVGAAVRDLAGRLGTSLTSVPISVHPAEADPDTFARLAGRPAPPAPVTTADAIAAIGACRVVLTGSYHAAVFALAQGVPAVGIALTDYYRSKFHGLSHQYGGALAVIEPGRSDFRERLAETVEAAWRWAPHARPELVEASKRQVEAGRAAYQRLTGLVELSGRAAE